MSSAAPMPTGEELYVFPFGRLTMSAFEALKREYPGVTPRNLVRIAMETQWLLEKQTTDKPFKPLQPSELSRCVRSLYPPLLKESEVTRAKGILLERFGISSPNTLQKNFNDASRGWSVEWNQSLAREYHIAP